MTAKIIRGEAPGGTRAHLADILPLDTPILIQFFPIYSCNFTCKYCVFSIPKANRGFISDKKLMSMKLYKKCLDEIAQFPDKAKTIRFVGMGEPLLHPHLAEMVKYAVSKNVTDRIEILTNGSLLTPSRSDALIAAGVSRLVISIQGTTAEKYRSVSNARINMEKFIANLRYFYERKGNIQVYIKIIDIALDDRYDGHRFYSLFGEVCDSMAVEHASPIYPGVEYNDQLMENTITQFGLPMSSVIACPQPFFTMQINPDGKVVPCYSVTYPGIMGDANQQTLQEIWNGPVYKKFRRDMLDNIKCDTCKSCEIIRFRLFPEDNLDNSIERLKAFYH